ncbi:MAG: pilus assembly protein PilP [Smithella sp.]|nr:pilus assembly protein PilP [Smithella sp.]
MRKVKFILLSAFTIVFMATCFAVAAEAEKTQPSAQPSTPVAAPATAAANVTPPASEGPAKPPEQAVLVPASPTTEVYNYNPVGKPDPFTPFIVIETTDKKKIEKAKVERKDPLSIFPLQRADTDRYRVVGIAGDEDHRVAIVEDAAKKFYPLFKGTRIGLRNGRVVEILNDSVIVEEYEGKKANRVILKLRRN